MGWLAFRLSMSGGLVASSGAVAALDARTGGGHLEPSLGATDCRVVRGAVMENRCGGNLYS
jgi:hypothetical protein